MRRFPPAAAAMTAAAALTLCGVAMPCSPARAQAATAAPAVQARDEAGQVVLDNGIVALTISKETSRVTSVRYRRKGGAGEVELGKDGTALYLDVNAGPKVVPPEREKERTRAGYQHLVRFAKNVRVVSSTPEAAEAVIEGEPTFWFPFRTEVHFRLPRGESGFYTWVVLRHGKGMPAGYVEQMRYVFRAPAESPLYTHHVVDDARRGPIPVGPPVQTVQDATYLLADGTVYTKYDNIAFLADHRLHGMAGAPAGEGLGVWWVMPGNEAVGGGPLKQELTVHVDNGLKDHILLNMLQGKHFNSGMIEVGDDEEWVKVWGPSLLYVNAGPSVDALYADARRREKAESAAWPYAWAASQDYPTERGTVTGRLRPTDGKSPAGAWVILSDSHGPDWAQQAKGYHFWARAGRDGSFRVPKVRPGAYTLYASGAGRFEPLERGGVTVEPGATTDLGAVEWRPKTHGRTLWEIGTADRSSAEFKGGDDVRHWGNFRRYAADFPEDVTFTVGKSNPARDWGFAHWTWYAKRPYWSVLFDTPTGGAAGKRAVLTIGIAASNPAGAAPGSEPAPGTTPGVRVLVNGTEVGVIPVVRSGGAAYRSGGQDSQYRVERLTFDASLLKPGRNEVRLAHRDATPVPPAAEQMSAKVGVVMYDALRLEVEE